MNETNHIAQINGEENEVTYEIENIKDLIYTIRGKQVILDSHVAMLYHYETKYINLAVKRNRERFPENFCFQLTEEELENLKSQFVISRVESMANSLRSQSATLEMDITQTANLGSQCEKLNLEKQTDFLRSQIVTLDTELNQNVTLEKTNEALRLQSATLNKKRKRRT